MLKKRNVMTIGTLAKTAGVGVETVRYYQRRGLMSEAVWGDPTLRRTSACSASFYSRVSMAWV